MIQLLTVLNWFTTKKAYLAPYVNDESAKKAATKLWTSIDKGDFSPFVLMFVIGILVCLYYYFPFNKQAGRHYQPKFWRIFLLIALILVFVSTYVLLEYVIAKNASFDTGFILKCCLMNTFYGLIVYIITSVIVCRTGKSNAYPIF